MCKTIFTSKNLLKAYLDCRKTKRKTINALKYELDLEQNLSKLEHSLFTRTYAPARSICFVVTVPKPREIFASEFTDRIAHHVLINQVQSIWEKTIFITDSYACRKGKGNHFGVRRMLEKVKRYKYYGQFDILNFFSKIDKHVLFECFSKVIRIRSKPDFWKNEVLWLAETIIFHNPTGNYFYKGDPNLKKLVPYGKSLFDQDDHTGMPIGNLTSQFLANVYLNELDHFVVDTLGCKGYSRYVDDFVVFADSIREITTWRDRISIFLKNNLSLTLHPKKQQIQPCAHGIPFVGYFIKPWGLTVRRNVVKTMKRKIYEFNKKQDVEHAVQSLNSYLGHLGKAKTNRLRKHLIKEHLSLDIKKKVIIVGNFHHLKLPKKYGENPPGEYKEDKNGQLKLFR